MEEKKQHRVWCPHEPMTREKVETAIKQIAAELNKLELSKGGKRTTILDASTLNKLDKIFGRKSE